MATLLGHAAGNGGYGQGFTYRSGGPLLLGDAAADPKVTVRLLSNQPLDAALQSDLEMIQRAFMQARESVRNRVPQLAAKQRRTAVRLRKVSGLSWERFGQLMACWDLESFGQGSLALEEAQIFAGMGGAFPDASIRLEAFSARQN